MPFSTLQQRDVSHVSPSTISTACPSKNKGLISSAGASNQSTVAGNKVGTIRTASSTNAMMVKKKKKNGTLNLAPPAKDNTYTTIEFYRLLLKHKKSVLINSIVASGYGPKRSSMYGWAQDVDKDTLTELLKEYDINTPTWHDVVDNISKIFGITTRNIKQLVDEDDQYCEEIATINANNNQSNTRLVTPTPPREDTTPSNSSLKRKSPDSNDARLPTFTTETTCDTRPIPLAPISSEDAVQVLRRELDQQGVTPAMMELYKAIHAKMNDASNEASPQKKQRMNATESHTQTDTDAADDSQVTKKMIHSAIQKAMAETKNGVIAIEGVDAAGKKTTQYLLPLPNPRKRRESSSQRAKRSWIQRRVGMLQTVFDWTIHNDSSQSLKDKVLASFAEENNLFAAREDKIVLSMSALVAMRDIVGGGNLGTNMMCRLKSSLETFCPELRGKVFPSCLKSKLGLFDANENDEIQTHLHTCSVNKDESRSKLANHAHLSRPCQLLERMWRKDYIEGQLENSEEFMNDEYHGKYVVSFNTDKSASDLVSTVKNVNRKSGNSALHTFPIAYTQGPISENYNNLRATHYNPEYSTKHFLQNLVDDRLFMLALTIGPTQCQCFVFLPTPAQDVCVNRFIDIDVLGDYKVASSVQFDVEPTNSIHSPQVEIPLDEKKISIQTILHSEGSKDIVGVEIVVNNEVKYTHKLRSPLKKEGNTPLEAQLLQIQGHCPNDMKMAAFINGVCSNAVLCGCIACVAEKSTWKKNGRSELVWKYMKRNAMIQDEEEQYPTDPPLREGDMSPQACFDRFQEETLNGTVLLSQAQGRETKIRNASVEYQPLLVIPPIKLLASDPMHVSSGIGNKCFNQMRSQIRALEDDKAHMVMMRDARSKVAESLKELTLVSGEKNGVTSLLGPLHDTSCKLRTSLSKARAKLSAAEAKRDEEDITNDEERAKLEAEIEELNQQFVEIFEMYKEHANGSNYSHLCQLQIGMSELDTALRKFFSKGNKKPRGPLEFGFNSAVEALGGVFLPDKGGFDQTNGVLLQTAEHFSKIAEICISVYGEDHPLHQQVSIMFAGYEEVVERMFDLQKLLRLMTFSQSLLISLKLGTKPSQIVQSLTSSIC